MELTEFTKSIELADFTESSFPTTFHIVAESIPRAYYQAIEVVWNYGQEIRTEYDRRNDAGEFIDPPSRDTRVLIEVKDPFAQPRFPPISFCEIGAYIAEIMGFKNGMVLPMSELAIAKEGKPLQSSLWPYSYHQRLTAHPESADATIEKMKQLINSSEYDDCFFSPYSQLKLFEAIEEIQKQYCQPIDQIEKAIDTLVKTPHSRRAVCTTAVPNLDPYLTEDIPCLRELMLRLVQDENGDYKLNATTTWRSRDLYKAWGDNVIGITFLLQDIARRIQAKMKHQNGFTGKVTVGSYADYSNSLHIYGQNFGAVGGNASHGLSGFFETFPTEDDFIVRSLDSATAQAMLVVPQMEKLLNPDQIEQWKITPATVGQLKRLIEEIEFGDLIV